MATLTRSPARRPTPEPMTVTETTPSEAATPSEPEPVFWGDYVLAWCWLAGAAILGVMHLWFHFVNAMRWWN